VEVKHKIKHQDINLRQLMRVII